MITEEYLKDNYVNAYFIDQERKNIEVLTTNEDKSKVYTTIIPYEEDGHQWKALQTKINIDQLHENTYQRNKLEQEQFEKSVLRIAENKVLYLSLKIKNLILNFILKS